MIYNRTMVAKGLGSGVEFEMSSLPRASDQVDGVPYESNIHSHLHDLSFSILGFETRSPWTKAEKDTYHHLELVHSHYCHSRSHAAAGSLVSLIGPQNMVATRLNRATN